MMHERERKRANVSTIRGKRGGEIIARTAVEPHLRASFAGNDAEAVVLDFVNPQAAGRQCVGLSGEARRDESGREGAHTQHNAHNFFSRAVTCVTSSCAAAALV